MYKKKKKKKIFIGNVRIYDWQVMCLYFESLENQKHNNLLFYVEFSKKVYLPCEAFYNGFLAGFHRKKYHPEKNHTKKVLLK